MFKAFWRLTDLRRALGRLQKTGHCILQGRSWSHDKTVYVIDSLLERGFDVTVEDFNGNKSRRFITAKLGSGKYVHKKSELNFRIPTYQGAHNYFR